MPALSDLEELNMEETSHTGIFLWTEIRVDHALNVMVRLGIAWGTSFCLTWLKPLIGLAALFVSHWKTDVITSYELVITAILEL